MRLNESTQFITGHVIYNPAYTYKFQLKTTVELLRTRLDTMYRDHHAKVSFLERDLHAQLECV